MVEATLIRLEDVTLSMGAHTLLTGVSLHVFPGDRVGLVGRNGAGKTSLLRLMMSQVEPDSGRVLLRNGARIGWLPQSAVSGSTRTVWDEAASGMARILALREALERAELAAAGGDGAAVARAEDAREQYRMGGGYTADERVGEVLHGLGFRPDDWTRSCATFSGGWQVRIALARVLLSEADLLLLDEPTNHLDLAARSWLADHLARTPATVLLVSHDRHLLDTVCTRTFEIRGGGVEVFSGNLTAWLAERERRDALAENTRDRQDAEIARLERFVERFGAKATKAAQATSRVRMIERIEAQRGDLPPPETRPRLVLPPPPGVGRDLVSLRAASLGWDGGPDVLSGVEVELCRGQRWVVLGANGAGKSTLLAGLSGRINPRSGQRRQARDVRVGLHVQDLAAELPPDRTALEQVVAEVPSVTPARARSVLGALGLSGDAAVRPIQALSGGEKARVVLAAFALRPYDLLLLDEPTNHLDAVTAEVLADALCAWEGGLVVVTHDRWLVSRIATHVLKVRDGHVDAHEGVRPEDLLPDAPVRRGPAVVSAAPPAGAVERASQKDKKRSSRRADKLTAELESVSADIDRVDADLVAAGADHVRARELAERRGVLEHRLEEIFAELEELGG